jgi:hypothetical protein
MGFFSKLFGRDKSPTSKVSPHLPTETFSITDLVIVSAPLGNVKGTVLDEGVIRSCIASVLKNHGTKINNLIIDRINAPFDFLATGYSHNSERGYAAVVRDNSGDNSSLPIDRRVLIGSAGYVRRATTDMHADLKAIIDRDLPVDSTLHVTAIDGIAYAAIVIKREMK